MIGEKDIEILYEKLEGKMEDLVDFLKSVEMWSREWLINKIEIMRVQTEMLSISKIMGWEENTKVLDSGIEEAKESLFKFIRGKNNSN